MWPLLNRSWLEGREDGQLDGKNRHSRGRRMPKAIAALGLLLHSLGADPDDSADRTGSAGDFTPSTWPMKAPTERQRVDLVENAF